MLWPADSFGVPVALTGALQLFARDFPELPFPGGTDLLQVLMCPLEHVDEETDHSDRACGSSGDHPLSRTFSPSFPNPRRTARGRGGLAAGRERQQGRWAFWWQTSPFGLECPACGADRRLLLVLHTHEELENELCSCEVAERAVVGWEFGQEGALNVFACTQDLRHPIKLHVD
ncbi:hypothetical protein C8D87_1011074 [Lentzea atacamensis]|uniref:Uncharacterized protein n=2 Tax=Lentzea atacamensis TaxID=531938 RepID=A0ABX9EID5_9PSEU|nr:hypothetical protein C8D87_1011074 [Lentzea atacamensis]